MPPFRASLILTAFVVLGLAILVSLGTWQARKIAPKTALIAQVEAGLAQPVRSLADVGAGIDYVPVSVTGRLRATDPVRVFGTNLDGKPGYHLYTGLERPVRSLVLSLGWVPFDQAIDNLELPLGEQITLTGVLVPSPRAGFMTPDNDIAGNVWHLADVDQLAGHFGFTNYYSYRLIASPWRGDALPQAGQVRVDIPNNHQEYMFTWYGLAAALLGVFLAFGISRGRAT